MEIHDLSAKDIGLSIQDDPSEGVLMAFGRNLRKSLSSVGFVYIRDHGVAEDLIKDAMKASKEYFLLPTKIKEAFPRDPEVQQGYVAPGREIFDQNEDGTKVVSYSGCFFRDMYIHTYLGHSRSPRSLRGYTYRGT